MAFPDVAQDILEDYVKAAVQKWQNNEIQDPWLRRSNVLIQHGEPVPDKTNLEHPFNRFLNAVAVEMANTFGDDQQRMFYRQLTKTDNVKIWQKLILQEMPAPRQKLEKKQEKKIKKIKKKPQVDADKTHAFDSLNLEEDHHFEEEADIDKPTDEMEKRRVKFEKERNEILESIPEPVKARFGQIYFGKWGKLCLPCLVMNPYSVSPGPVRDKWLNMREKVMAQNRLQSMTNLVYWYGASKDMANAYSFLATSQLTPYENGVAKKMNVLPKATQKKIDEESSLSAQEEQVREGLEEMKEDLDREPSVRCGYVGMDFPEDWEYTEEDVVKQEMSTEQDVKKSKGKEKKPKKIGGKKRKKDQVIETSEVEAELVRDGSKKKSKKGKKQTKSKEVVEFFDATPGTGAKAVDDTKAATHGAVTVVTPSTAKASLPQYEQADRPSEPEVDLDYKFAMGEIPSEGEDAEDFEDNDGDFGATGDEPLVSGAINPKQTKAKDQKDRPKKKEQTVKHKTEKKDKVPKSPLTDEQKINLEQKRFALSERKFHPTFTRWREALDAKDEERTIQVMSDIEKQADKIHFSLMPDINGLLKASKKVVSETRKDAIKQLRAALKIQYELKKKDFPLSFKPIRKFPTIDSQPSSTDSAARSSDKEIPKRHDSASSLALEELPKSASSVSLSRVGSLERVAEKPEMDVAPNRELKVERKKFSLGKLMRPDVASSANKSSKMAAADVSATTNQSLQKGRKSIPAWMTDEKMIYVPRDETRAFGVEFLKQACTFIVDSNGANLSLIACALEAAINKVADCSTSTEKYWKKIDDIVVAISGDKKVGTIANMISRGAFESAEMIVDLPDDKIYDSFLGRPVLL